MEKTRNPFTRLRHSEYARLAFYASIAATAAFIVGLIAPNVSSVVAAITALLATRSTFHESILEGGRQVAGTVAGAIVGGVLLVSFGFNPFVLVASLVVAYGIGRLLRLGEEGALTIAVTVILVLGLHLDGDAVESRILGVVVGAAIALLLSLFVPLENPQDRALNRAVSYSRSISALLKDISGALRKRSEGIAIPQSLAQKWLDEAEQVRVGLEELVREAEEIAKGAKWSPVLQRDEAEQVLAQCRIATDLSVTVVGMCRELLVTEATGSVSNTLALHLSEMFDAAADVVASQAETAHSAPAQALPANAPSVRAFAESQVATRGAVRDLDETGALLLGGSLLQDGATIKHILADEGKQN